MKKLGILAAAGAAFLFAAPAAWAADFTPAFAASRAGGFIDLWPSHDATVGMFGAELQIGLTRHAFLDMSFTGAFAGVSYADGGQLNAGYGNPTIGAHYAGDATSRLSFFLGGALTLPLLANPDNDVAFVAYNASAVRGYYDLDRLSPGRFAIRAAGGLEWEITEHAYFRAEVRPVVFIPVNDRYSPVFDLLGNQRDPYLAIEQAVEFEGRLRSGLGFGARLQGVVTPSNDDALQVVFEPFLGLTPRRGRGLYLRLGFPLALDEPLGFGLDENKLAAVRFSIGGQW